MLKKFGFVIVSVGLVTTGCGDLAEKVAEEALEEAIEAGEGGDIEIDFGDIEDGEFTVTGEDGESISFGSTELPDDFDLPVPEDINVITSSFLEDPDGGKQGFVVLETDANRYEEVVSFYEDWASTQEGVTRSESTSDLTSGVSWLVEASSSHIGVVSEANKTIVSLTQIVE